MKKEAPSSVKHLNGNNILVTGANGVLGEKLVEQFAAEGANLILPGRNLPALNQVAEQVHAKYSVNCITYQLDLRLESEFVYRKLTLYLEKNLSWLDMVVLNASYKGSESSLLNYPNRMWKDVMQVNLDANMMLVKSLLPLLMKAKRPLLAFTLDEENNYQKNNPGAYVVSKSGLRTLMQMIAHEFSDSHLVVLGVEPVCAQTISEKEAKKNDAGNGKTGALSAREIARLYVLTLLNSGSTHRGKVIRLE